jgi:hypothetical protein
MTNRMARTIRTARRRWSASRYLYDLRFRRPKVYPWAKFSVRVLTTLAIVMLCELFADLSWYLLSGWTKQSECEGPFGPDFAALPDQPCAHYLPPHWWAYHPLDGWELLCTQTLGVGIVLLSYTLIWLVRDHRRHAGC